MDAWPRPHGGTSAIASRTWPAALSRRGRQHFASSPPIGQPEPLALVLDEVPYLARSTPGFPSIVQTVWDHLPRTTRLLLVLTGSAVGTVEAMLGGGGALRGRPTDTLRLDPLDPVNARRFLPRLDPVRFFEAYAGVRRLSPASACLGIPAASAEDNLERLAGTAGGYLLEDAGGILREELPESGGYAASSPPSVAAARAMRRSPAKRVARGHALDVLVRSGFVAKVAPVGAPRAARGIYAIASPYLGVLVPGAVLRPDAHRGRPGSSASCAGRGRAGSASSGPGRPPGLSRWACASRPSRGGLRAPWSGPAGPARTSARSVPACRSSQTACRGATAAASRPARAFGALAGADRHARHLSARLREERRGRVDTRQTLDVARSVISIVTASLISRSASIRCWGSVRAASMSSAGKLTAAIRTLGDVAQLVEDKRATIARLRRLLFGATSEKTRDVLTDQHPADPGYGRAHLIACGARRLP